MKYNRFLGSRKNHSFRDTVTPPPVLYKRTNLVLDSRTGELKLAPLTAYYYRVDLNADAKCDAHAFALHKSPAKTCSCGFYAYTNPEDALRHPQGGKIVLKVVASGKLFEYGKGYRYEHQRVAGIDIPNCAWCQDSAIQFVVGEQRFLWPACKKHSGRRLFGAKKELLSFARVEELASQALPSHAPQVTIQASQKQ